MSDIDFDVDLLKMPAEVAVDEKFARGRARYGGEWQGARPILEAHSELLDCLAYLREEMEGRTGQFPGGELPDLVMGELYRVILNGLQGVRIMIEASGVLEEPKDGTQDGFEDGGGEGTAGGTEPD